ncbi:MAG: NAD-dependent epimerase/dehydratase family protein [Planctomycetota bacterium]|jgi:nucleoside-diphosphate-sugar epimerase
MKRLIIGCGYLGRRVAQRWLNAGDSVFALTRSTGNATELRNIGIEPIRGDVTQRESLANLPSCDTVLHAVGFDRTAAASKREVYVDGLRNILDQVAGCCEHFVHVSSTSVYGQQDGEQVDEHSPTEPIHESGAICLDAEQLVSTRVANGTYRNATILRLAGIYGPGRLLARVDAIRQQQPLPGNPDAWLNLIHVDDAADIVVAAALQPASRSTDQEPSLFLVSDDQPIQRRTYYETLARLLEVDDVHFDVDAPARHTHGLGKRCSNLQLREQLEITLKYPTIETGLPNTISTS